MSVSQDALNREASRFIAVWLVDPTRCDLRQVDLPAILGAVESRLRDAWERGRHNERRALVKLKESLLAYQQSVLQESEREPEPVMETGAGIKHEAR